MENVIAIGMSGLGLGFLAILEISKSAKAKKAQRLEEQKLAEPWVKHQAMLERAAEARAEHPERYQACAVPAPGKDGVYVV